MDQRRYRRYFIILDNEAEGFQNKQGKNPKGYTKIEIKNGKGVLSHYIQNIKYFDSAEYIYRGYLIGTKDGKEICADNGTFLIDENGKGELNWRFDPENVDGKGNPIVDFNVIAIIAEPMDIKTRGMEVVSPLVGFIDKQKVGWKHVLINNRNNKESQGDEVLEEAYKEEFEKIMDIIGQEEVEVIIEIDQDEEDHGEVSHMRKEKEVEVKEEIKEKIEEKKEEKKEEIKEEKKEKIEVKIEEKIEEKKEEIKEKPKVEKPYCEQMEYGKMKYYDYQKPHKYYHYYFKMVCGYVENILKYYQKVEPFQANITKCNWWKIDWNQQTLYRNFLPFYGYIGNVCCYYPYMKYMTGCHDLIYKYQHYIFGIVHDEKDEPMYYLYGIPGRFMINEQPYEGMTGFVYWHPIENKPAEKGDYGYWILHIDAKTGNVVMPLQPTPPPRY